MQQEASRRWHLNDLVRAQRYDLIAALIDGDVGDGCSMALQHMHLSVHANSYNDLCNI